jgi:hypothetical protein
LVARVSSSLISSPFLIKIKRSLRKEYLICDGKGKNDFYKYKEILKNYKLSNIKILILIFYGPLFVSSQTSKREPYEQSTPVIPP